jgi:guanosine-3',5'-bis(diphosphate) 3'-pyrophosphohydrolase
MRLRNIFEDNEKSVGMIFGRFNPPHVGHKAAWEMAAKNPAWYVGTNQSTLGKKDPLPYDVKVQAMKAIMPEIADHIIPHQSWITLASAIYKEHPAAVLKVYTDEAWVIKALQQYNGVEGKPHGYYNFPRIDAVETPRLSSATALRDAVAQGNRKAFATAAGVSANTDVGGMPYFDVVNKYLSPYLKESVEEDSDDALKYATKQHTGQTRSDGSAYIKHPERVGNTVAKLKKSKNLDAIISAAYLHDTIEDTDTTHADLEKMFGGLVASIVKELTSDKEQIKKVGKEQYLTNKMIKMSSYSLVVKLADRLDNVQDIATAKTPEWRENYKNQTLGILSKLEAGRVLSNTHKQIISMIKDKLQEINSDELGEQVMKAKMFTGYSKGKNKKGHPDKGKLVGEAVGGGTGVDIRKDQYALDDEFALFQSLVDGAVKGNDIDTFREAIQSRRNITNLLSEILTAVNQKISRSQNSSSAQESSVGKQEYDDRPKWDLNIGLIQDKYTDLTDDFDILVSTAIDEDVPLEKLLDTRKQIIAAMNQIIKELKANKYQKENQESNVGEASSNSQYKQLADFGRKLMDKATSHSDDNVSAMMSSIGNELTKFGAMGGASSIEELEKKTGVGQETILKMMDYAKTAIEKEGAYKLDDQEPDQQEPDTNPQYKEIADFGRKLLDKGASHSDKNIGKMMNTVGNELTKFGTASGVKSVEELGEKTGIGQETILKMMDYAKTAIAQEIDEVDNEVEGYITATHNVSESIYASMERKLQSRK